MSWNSSKRNGLSSGLRGLQSKRELIAIIKRVRTAMKHASPAQDPKVNTPKRPPAALLVKIAPDLSAEERADIAAVATARGTQVDGLVVSNTTIARPHVMHGEHSAKETGGLSGAPLMGPSTEMLADMYKYVTPLLSHFVEHSILDFCLQACYGVK